MNTMIKVLILAILLLINFISCKGQVKDNSFDLKNYYYKIDTTNEVEQPCKLFLNKYDPELALLECYTNVKPEKLMARLFLKKGKYHGPCWYWTDDGVLSFLGEYYENNKNGKWIYYFSDKTIAEKWFDKGRKVGIWKEYDKTGKIISQTNYGY